MRQMSRVSNCFMVEAVIMHETKGFSCVIRDKIYLYEKIVELRNVCSQFLHYLKRDLFSCELLTSRMFSASHGLLANHL